MLLQSPPPDVTIHQAFDFGSHLDRQALADRAPDKTLRHEVAEILDSVAELAEVRPVVFDRRRQVTVFEPPGGMAVYHDRVERDPHALFVSASHSH